MRVQHFMTRNPVACEASTPIRDVAEMMRENNVGAVVVLRTGKVDGIVTDRDLALRVVAEGGNIDAPVDEVMTKDPGRVHVGENIFAVLDTMRSSDVARRVPVVNQEDELVGLVSISDVAVIAKRLLDGVLLEQTHHALNEPHVETGGKRIIRRIRSPIEGPGAGPAAHQGRAQDQPSGRSGRHAAPRERRRGLDRGYTVAATPSRT